MGAFASGLVEKNFEILAGERRCIEKMKKITIYSIAVLLLLAWSVPLLMAKTEVAVTRAIGDVKVLLKGSKSWVRPYLGMVLREKDKIKTGEGAKVELLLDERNKVWVTEKSEIEVSKLDKSNKKGEKESEVSLILGKIKTKINLLKPKNKFYIRTPTAVISIRGTELAVEVTEKESKVMVFAGSVDVTNLVNNETTSSNELEFLTIDNEGNKLAGKIEENELQQEIVYWENIGKEFDIKEMSVRAERENLYTFVNETKVDVADKREVTREIKNNDFSSGRTLRDIHGNLVRVEQSVSRPNNRTFEFLNITHRDIYVYKGMFDYSGPSGARTDFAQFQIVFNKDLPTYVSEWPKFIEKEGDTFHPDRILFKLSNGADELKFEGNWYERTVLKEYSFEEEKGIEMKSYLNGREFVGDESIEIGEPKTLGEDKLGIGVELPILFKDNNERAWIQLEGYVLNNKGEVLTLGYFVKSEDKDPLSVLKEIAFEGIITAKKENKVDNLFTRGNIDIVGTPDLVINAIEKNLPTVVDVATSVSVKTGEEKF